jgi:hypothetical protein
MKDLKDSHYIGASAFHRIYLLSVLCGLCGICWVFGSCIISMGVS